MDSPLSFECEIQWLLKDRKDVEVVADDIYRKWELGGLTFDEQRACGLFLLRVGRSKAVFSRLASMLRNSEKIPWELLVESCKYVSEKIPNSVVDQILMGASLENGLEAVVNSQALDQIDDRISRIREKVGLEREKKAKDVRDNFLAQIKILTRDRLFSQVNQLLDLLGSKFPGDKEVSEIEQKLGELKARDFIESKQRETLTKSSYNTADNIPADLLENIEKSFVGAAKQKPTIAYDLAVALLQMDFPQISFKVLAYAERNSATEWLEIDLLLLNGRFLDALGLIDKIEKKYTDDSEAPFSAMYSRARALWGLGQGPQAIAVLQSILKLRPHFRSAHSLLLDWKDKLS